MMYAVRDLDDGAVHSSRYYEREDAVSAIEEIAYEFDIDESQLDVVEVAA